MLQAALLLTALSKADMVMSNARDTACVCTGPAWRDGTHQASKYRRGETAASGRAGQVRPAARPASVMVVSRVGAPAVP